MQALTNLALYDKTNGQLSNLEKLQRQIQEQMSLMPVMSADEDFDQLYHDPFNPEKPKEKKKGSTIPQA